MQYELSYHDCVCIAAKAIVSPMTVKRVYAGARATSTTRARIQLAASKLKLPLPPQQTEPEVA